jgi:uncharacterized membrane protein
LGKWILKFRENVVQPLLAGALLLLPIYLAFLLLLKAMKSLAKVVRPLARLMPQSFPGETVISLLLVLALCLIVGLLLRTSFGQRAWLKVENSLLQKIPGYATIRGMTRQLSGQSEEHAWQPALAEIEEALVPAFIVEELDGGRYTVFVPAAPTPLTGSIYILTADRVHPLNVPFTHAIKVLTHWGSGSQELIAAMQDRPAPSPAPRMTLTR